MQPIQRPTGTFDVLPAPGAALPWAYTGAYAHVFAVHARVAAAHGYRLVQTPVFEKTEMFERGIGAGTDVVDKEMYSFTTGGGDAFTLRPEATPATVRAVLGAHLDQEVRPVRVQYAGPMFRHDKNQRGRYRQFHQVGIEAIGERTAALDAEIVEVGWRFYEALGITGVSLQINTLGDLEDRRRYRDALVAYYTPHLAELCADCKRRLEINPLRLLDCKEDQRLVAAAPDIDDALSEESRTFFEAVLGHLSAAGIPFERNRRLVRGLDYYAHTTFEYWHTGLQGAQNALGGGGRYDGLAEVLGFAATPGCGYALGVERALLILESEGHLPGVESAADVAVCTVGEGAADAAATLARRLREDGLRVVVDAAPRKLDKKIRNADRLGARACVILGDDEVAQGTAMVRDLARHEQERCGQGAVPDAVAEILARGDT